MRQIMWVLLLLACASGCTENNTVTAKDKVEIHVANPSDVPILLEVAPDLSPVRLWLGENDSFFVFDGEHYGDGDGKESRRTIQSAIAERYPTYRIERLLERRDGDIIVYFAYIKPKPGMND